MGDIHWMQESVRTIHVAAGAPVPKRGEINTKLECAGLAKAVLEDADNLFAAMGIELSGAGDVVLLTQIFDPEWDKVLEAVVRLLYSTMAVPTQLGVSIVPYFLAAQQRLEVAVVQGEQTTDPPFSYLWERALARANHGDVAGVEEP